MVLRVHILSDKWSSQNTRAFLYPLIRHAPKIRKKGASINFFYDVNDPGLVDCDVLALNSNYWRGSWRQDDPSALEKIAKIAAKAPATIYFDRSSGPANLDPELFPLVEMYCKSSLLKDRQLYLRPLYGQRQFTDYYHREFGVEDTVVTRSRPLSNEADLEKLRLGWNTGLANYSVFGPKLVNMYRRIPARLWMLPTPHFADPGASRTVPVSCRMNIEYDYETLSYQRRRLSEMLANFKRTGRIGKLAYVRELAHSKVVASPFGSSEINYKDFEVFITGGALLKPDMSHIETFPDLFEDGVTYFSHAWDFKDLENKLQTILADDDSRIEVARAGQARYRKAVATNEGGEAFVDRFVALVREASAIAQPQRSTNFNAKQGKR
jgi:hypothetical protein